MKKAIYRVYSFAEKCFCAILFRRKEKSGWRNAYKRTMWKHCARIGKWWPEMKEEFVARMQEALPNYVNGRLRLAWNVWNFRFCALLLGANVNDWFSYHLYKKNWRDRRKAVTSMRIRFINKHLNDRGPRHLVDNKQEFAELWREFFKRRSIALTAENKITEDEFAERFRGIRKLVIKPVKGTGGKDTYIIDTDDLRAVYRRLCEKNEDVIVEEYIQQTGFIHELNPSSLNTNRVITMRIEGEPEVVTSELRIGEPGSVVDNAHSGGMIIQIDMQTGKMVSGSDYKGRDIKELPGVGLPLYGTVIPDHEKILQFCIDAHRIAPYGLRMIGWDVCRSDDGLTMIEGNVCPGFANAAECYSDPWRNACSYMERFDELNRQIRIRAKQRKERIRQIDGTKDVDIYPDLCSWFKDRTGEEADLLNPKTYCQKIQWMKLYDSTPRKTLLADKYLVRDHVANTIGEKYLTKLYGVWDSFGEIDFDKLPDRFVLKTNHGCGYNLLVPNKAELDKEDARKKFEKWMNTDFSYVYGYEMHYRDIPRKIIAEEYLDLKGEGRIDYKITCIGGKVELIQFINRLEKMEIEVCVYDRDWKKLPFTFGHPMYEKEIKRPERLGEMIEIAEKLSSGFSLVRVDLYILKNDEIRFGELTFTPASGAQRWFWTETNRKLGEKIKLPEKYYLPGISYDFEKNIHKQAQ